MPTISPLSPLPAVTVQPAQTSKSGSGFGAVLEETINRVDGYRNAAVDSAQKFLSGEQEELHSVVLAAQRADLEFELFLQVRNKVVQAYQEIMRMQV